MILVAHIAIAVASIVYTAYLYMSPSRRKLQVSAVLAALTLASGVSLVVSVGTHMVQACATGLLYFGVVSYGMLAARQKLAAEQSKER